MGLYNGYKLSEEAGSVFLTILAFIVVGIVWLARLFIRTATGDGEAAFYLAVLVAVVLVLILVFP